jgi:hypothetical protein
MKSTKSASCKKSNFKPARNRSGWVTMEDSTTYRISKDDLNSRKRTPKKHPLLVR